MTSFLGFPVEISSDPGEFPHFNGEGIIFNPVEEKVNFRMDRPVFRDGHPNAGEGIRVEIEDDGERDLGFIMATDFDTAAAGLLEAGINIGDLREGK